uniref:SusC/RagA family TonB-linked outer membrane protein n=1 Tax=Draconibacterium sp. TaxID=1965318 RepID=UPI0035637761
MQNIISYSLKYLWHVSNLSIGTNNWSRRLFIISFIFLLCINQLQAQTITVTGRVTDQNDQPLPGVNVVIKETPSTGTITKDDGLYLLKEVHSDAVLFFSFIGFKTLEIPLNGRSHLNVQLQEDITTLTEVTVNAGYYTVKDQERTGSIARVRSKELENQPVSNALSSVQGRMAGVNITQSSGVPGGGYNIQIRGTNSLRRDGNYPLYIIDGVPATLQSPSALGGTIIPYGEIDPLNAINPNDIESIEILKDADATAIYGSRGANGVILVTTKKGKTGSRTALSINSSYGVSQIARKMKLMDTPQYLDMRRQAYANDGITDYPANAYDINGTWDDTRYTDWQEELIGNTATNSMLQFSLNGGGNNSRFLISGSHNEQTTVFSDDFKYKTDNISGNFSHHSSDNRFMLNASGLFSNQSNNLIQTEITSQALRLSPNAPALYKEDGSLNWENNTFNNPLAAYESTYSYKSKTFNSDLNLQYEVLPSLYIKANGGISYTSFEEIMLRPNTMYNPAYGLTPDFSQAFKNLNQNFSWIVEPQLNYRHTFNNHDIDVLVGGTLQQTQRTTLNIMGYGFESNTLITNLAAAANVMVTGDDKTEYRYAALFGRINYKYKERYILNLTGRRDGSSRFGPDQRFASFGAIGAAWIFSKEYFISSASWLSFGKLRASYGITGSDLIGDYQFLDTYTVSNT